MEPTLGKKTAGANVRKKNTSALVPCLPDPLQEKKILPCAGNSISTSIQHPRTIASQPKVLALHHAVWRLNFGVCYGVDFSKASGTKRCTKHGFSLESASAVRMNIAYGCATEDYTRGR